MAHVIMNVKDGIDSVIEQARAIETMLERQSPTPASVAAIVDMKVAMDALQRARSRVGVARL